MAVQGTLYVYYTTVKGFCQRKFLWHIRKQTYVRDIFITTSATAVAR